MRYYFIFLGCIALQSWGSTDTYQALSTFSEAFRTVRSQFPKSVSDQKLIEAAIDGMMSKALDPYSGYLNHTHYQDVLADVKGEFWGIGIEFTQEKGKIVIITAIDGTPAHKQGIVPGDIIVAINDQPIIGKSLEEVAELLKGGKREKLTLVLQRNLKECNVTLERTNILPNAIRHEIIDGIGYIRISNFFTGTTFQHFKEALTHLEKQKVQGLIIDIRNNPGGLLDQVIKIANLFLETQLIVSIQPKDHQQTTHHSATNGVKSILNPIVILVNEGTASAAEILAAALKDNRKAILMGSKTYGKGSVQTLIPLTHHQGALRLTTAYYITPNGKHIDGEGILPDVTVPGDNVGTSTDALKAQAIGLIKMGTTYKTPPAAQAKPEKTGAPLKAKTIVVSKKPGAKIKPRTRP